MSNQDLLPAYSQISSQFTDIIPIHQFKWVDTKFFTTSSNFLNIDIALKIFFMWIMYNAQLWSFLHEIIKVNLMHKTFDVWEAYLEIVVKVRVFVRMFGIDSGDLRSLCVLSACSCLHPLVHHAVVVLGALLVEEVIV
uniref:Uncharacterized protein n=1 Tax=Glossina austeni TaxID=7395 RepID=A0A1A9VG96_GLOAU